MADGAKLYSEIVKMSTISHAIQSIDSHLLPMLNAQPHWYAAYTCANHEKKATAGISRRGFEVFLPVYRTFRRWSDRRVELEVPLFAGYVFVHLSICDRLQVLQVPGIVGLVGFGGLPAALPNEEVNALRLGLASGLRAEPHPFLTVGRRVRIKHGPFAGLEGILRRRKGKLRVVISIDLIMRSVVLDADATDVEAL